MPLVGTKIVLNNQNAQQTLSYQITLDADINNPVGFTFNSYAFCNTVFDGSYIFVNGNNIGLVGGDEPEDIHSCAGVRGAFYYQNNQLLGLANDTPTPSMTETDALASIENYIQDPTNLIIQFEYQTPNIVDNKTNPVHQLFFAYSPTCQPFDVTVPNDTTVCYGSQVQLNATGGSSTGSLPAYEWSPATGLSCTTCPNPIFTADSSMFYTVRIRNNDSCSVVRPVKINVRPIPSINAISTVATECGSSTGSLTATGSLNGVGLPMQDLFVVTEIGDTLSASSQNQQSASVSNLGAGNYTVFYTDTNGCESLDSVVTISSINNTIADFTVTPTSGGAPLTVNVNNGSQNASNYEWFVSTPLNNPFSTAVEPGVIVFDTLGTYQIMLVAWQNDPACADTAYMNVVVFDSLVVQIPNVFSPNGDGINDFFSITVNQDVKAQIQIVNRWGNNLFSFDGLLKSGVNDLWDGADVSDGVYFYKLTVDMMTVDMKTVDMLTGYNGQLKKEGFVTIVGK